MYVLKRVTPLSSCSTSCLDLSTACDEIKRLFNLNNHLFFISLLETGQGGCKGILVLIKTPVLLSVYLPNQCLRTSNIPRQFEVYAAKQACSLSMIMMNKASHSYTRQSTSKKFGFSSRIKRMCRETKQNSQL